MITKNFHIFLLGFTAIGLFFFFFFQAIIWFQETNDDIP